MNPIYSLVWKKRLITRGLTVVLLVYSGGVIWTAPLWAKTSTGRFNETCPFVLIAPESSPEKPLCSERQTQICLLFTNDTEKALPLPGSVSLSFSTQEAKVFTAVAVLEAKAVDWVKPRGFTRADYTVTVPAGLKGLVKIQDSLKKTNAVRVYTDLPRETLDSLSSPIPKSFSRYKSIFQPYFVNFSSYKPVYFLFGVDPGIQESTFQLSFKYKLFTFNENNFLKKAFEKIYLAYTQQSFWDLKSDSAPFEDSRYMPELFYYEDDLGLKLPFLIGSGFIFGYQHESNGQGGDDSRSTNYIYFQPAFVFKLTPGLMLAVSPRIWVYVNNNEGSNGDLADYRGYFDLVTGIGNPQGLALTSHYRHGKKGATVQFDLSYPLDQIPFLGNLMDVYLYARYTSGYSEQMLEYDQREDVFSLGLALTR